MPRWTTEKSAMPGYGRAPRRPATCVETAGQDRSTEDAEVPLLGFVLHDLTRGDNACAGVGNLGLRSDGSERIAPRT